MANDLSAQIHWLEWEEKSFVRAEKEDKIILLDISATWCHWCHVMDRTTYSDPKVIDIINDRFIPIRVDADKRPDVQERYLLGGWPTTAFLLSDGRMLTGATFIGPQAMILKLEEVDTMYHENKELVTMQASSLEAEAEADRTDAEIPMERLDKGVISTLTDILKKDYDSVNCGYGKAPKFPYPDAIRFAFFQYRKTGDKELRQQALENLDAMMKIYDPVWGGFYRYAVKADWTETHYEKLLFAQAAAIDNYLEAYQITGENKYGETAAGIKSYISRFLTDNENGGFYASQDADVNSHDPDAELVLGEEYFGKNEADRLAIGVPYVDKTIYTDWNGAMISAYLRLYDVMGDIHARDFALKSIDRILEDCMANSRICHYCDGEPKLPGVLADQVYFAMALADAYQSTGTRRYLDIAETLVHFMETELQDVVDGGFYFRLFDPHVKIEPLERHKPFDDNVFAISLLTRLHYLTGNDNYRVLAERTLRAISYPEVTQSIVGMGYGVALNVFVHPPVHIVLVGDKNDKRTQVMLENSLHAYAPEKLVQLLDPNEGPLTIGSMTYEAQEEPVAYVCVDSMCHPPAKGIQELAAILKDMLG